MRPIHTFLVIHLWKVLGFGFNFQIRNKIFSVTAQFLFFDIFVNIPYTNFKSYKYELFYFYNEFGE